jgi:hypothetical protein
MDTKELLKPRRECLSGIKMISEGSALILNSAALILSLKMRQAIELPLLPID